MVAAVVQGARWTRSWHVLSTWQDIWSTRDTHRAAVDGGPKGLEGMVRVVWDLTAAIPASRIGCLMPSSLVSGVLIVRSMLQRTVCRCQLEARDFSVVQKNDRPR